MKRRQNILLLTHAVMYEGSSIHGPAHAVMDILSKEHKTVLIEHPLSGSHPSWILERKKRKLHLQQSSAGLLRWVKEIISNFMYILRYRPAVVIAIDPINAFPVTILHAFGLVRNFVYYTVDFADRRSANAVVDWLYHFLDTLSAQSADQCWAVSQRILQFRQKAQLISTKNLFHVPNSPAFLPKRVKKRDPYALVIVSNIHKGVGFEEIFSSFFLLAKKFPQLTLSIIGDGDLRTHFEIIVEKKKMSKRVHFHGRLAHKQVHEILSRSGVGLALYTGYDSHRYYSDSMKARDYLSEGMPVVISGDLGTAQEIELSGAGKWVELNTPSITSAVESILESTSIYQNYSTRAYELAKQRDFAYMVSIPLQKLLV